MPKLISDDLVDGSISFTRATDLFNIYNGLNQPSNSVTAAQGALYSSNTTGSYNQPLWIKNVSASTGSGPITGSMGWGRISDWQIAGVSLTYTAPFAFSTATNVSATVGNVTLTIGTCVGIYGPGAWTQSSGNLNVSRSYPSGCGSQNAALIAGGENASNNAITTTELFNGSSWVLSGNLNVSRYQASGCGSQNAGLVAGGFNSSGSAVTTTELFNGSGWVSGANLNISRYTHSGCGSQNAGLVAGGLNAGVAITNTELFNGSTWSTSGNLNVSRYAHSGCGSQNAALVAGGLNSGSAAITTTELFNGSSWVLSGNLNVSRYQASGCGSQNAALIAGGLNSGSAAITTTELFNGSTWSLSGNLNVSRDTHSGYGSQNAGLVAGGLPAGVSQSTSELHNQKVYTPMNYQNYKCAKNIGIIANNISGTPYIAFSGYVNNITMTSNNTAVTTAAQWVSTFSVLSPNSSSTFNAAITSTDGSIAKAITILAQDDIIIGVNTSQTELTILGNLLGNQFPIVRW